MFLINRSRLERSWILMKWKVVWKGFKGKGMGT